MLTCAVRLPVAAWRPWLERVADTAGLRAVEVPGDLLDDASPPVLDAARHLGITAVHAADVLPPPLARHLAETELGRRPGMLAALATGLRRRLAHGIPLASIDLGLDRMAANRLADELRLRLDILRLLVDEARQCGVTLLVRVRLPPPFPGSRAKERAANLVHDLATDHCGLALDVAVEEMPLPVSGEALARSMPSRLAVVRLFHDAGCGESAIGRVRAVLSPVLLRHSSVAVVVFCPLHASEERAAGVLAEIGRWAGSFRRSSGRP